MTLVLGESGAVICGRALGGPNLGIWLGEDEVAVSACRLAAVRCADAGASALADREDGARTGAARAEPAEGVEGDA